MKSYLDGLKKGYDDILIECMPSVGMQNGEKQRHKKKSSLSR